jgi:hypothetical protein
MNHCCTCGVDLPIDRVLDKCTPCHRKQVKAWRNALTSRPTREFPGVDIDAIHVKRGAVRKVKAA